MLCITPYTAKILYEILANGIPTVSQDCLLKQLPTAALLDKNLFEQTMSMMSSADEANVTLAHEILANSDYSNADLYLYQIAQRFYTRLSSSRFKNVRLFVEETDLKRFVAYTDDSFLNYLTETKQLSREALDVLLPSITEAAYRSVTNNKSSIFKINMELRPDLAAILGEHEYNKEIAPGQKPTPEEQEEMEEMIDIDAI